MLITSLSRLSQLYSQNHQIYEDNFCVIKSIIHSGKSWIDCVCGGKLHKKAGTNLMVNIKLQKAHG